MDPLPNVHPSEVLREEFLVPFGLSQYRLAKLIGVPEGRVSAICRTNRAVTADTALRLALLFGTSPGFWLSLQADFDVEEAARKAGPELARIERWRPVSDHDVAGELLAE
jgi:antitoxin HigA-1